MAFLQSVKVVVAWIQLTQVIKHPADIIYKIVSFAVKEDQLRQDWKFGIDDKQATTRG
jgi:hypothetical protein